MAKTTILLSILFSYATTIVSIISMSKLPITVSTTQNTSVGITIDLIHREHHPQSPYYNSSLSPSQRIANTFERSFIRVNLINGLLVTPQSDVSSAQGEYVMALSVGTPPVPALVIVDTGSDLVWIQCDPCIQCYKQKLPIFNRRNSSTFQPLLCSAPSCKWYSGAFCSSTGTSCLYKQSYMDGTTTQGGLVMDTITLSATDGNDVKFNNFKWGCAVKNTAVRFSQSGIVGLGGGRLSLVKQIGQFIQPKFSYCFVPYYSSESITSKLNFGLNAVVEGNGVVVIPLVYKDPVTFYHVKFNGISIGDEALRLDVFKNGSKFGSEEGNMVIDSGSTLTFLPTVIWNAFQFEVTRRITLPRTNGLTSVCYFSTEAINFPLVTIHLGGGDLVLSPDSIFVRFNDDRLCLAFEDAKNDIAILGNLAQTNFLVGYDLETMNVSFKPKDCTKP